MIWARQLFSLPLFLLAAQLGYPSVKVIPAKLNPETAAAFERYVAKAETRMNQDSPRDSSLRGGELRIEPGGAGRDTKAPGGMIQDWIGNMFMPGATLAQVQNVLRDYATIRISIGPK